MIKEGKGAAYRRAPKRKVCPFCANKVDEVDYIALVKDIEKNSEKIMTVTENAVLAS